MEENTKEEIKKDVVNKVEAETGKAIDDVKDKIKDEKTPLWKKGLYCLIFIILAGVASLAPSYGPQFIDLIFNLIVSFIG